VAEKSPSLPSPGVPGEGEWGRRRNCHAPFPDRYDRAHDPCDL